MRVALDIFTLIVVASVFVAVLLNPKGFATAVSSVGTFVTGESAILSTQAGTVKVGG